MTDSDSLTALSNRLRSGDTQAMEELIASYKEEVKAAIRHILNAGNRLRRTLDSSEILQSILIRLQRNSDEAGLRVADGAAYLGTLVRNRVRHHGRKLATQKRDPNRVSYGEKAL